ncbi:helix-turn-helix domain-containing protein [Lutibacter sp. B2]|nr:helix-turn-helix domain-containing protein [Lutibacter sp. B2]
MGDGLNLSVICLGARNGNMGDLDTLMKHFERYVRKYSYVNGLFDEDAYQDMSIKLWKCLKNSLSL